MLLVYLAIGIGLLVLVGTLLHAATHASPRKLATGVKVGAGIGGGLLAFWLLITGRVGSALALLPMISPLLQQMRRWRTQARNTAGPASGQNSEVQTAYLRMSLDHDSGAIDGTVLKGRHGGRRLDELSSDALLDLLTELRVDDEEGAALLEAYVDKIRPEWRSEGSRSTGRGEEDGPGPASAAMTREEAYRILDLAPGADESQIREAHRRLMLKLHPDSGGSNYLAAKINQARDVLLEA